MADLPFMPLYVGDYLKDTRRLTTEEHGAYLLLLMTMWCEGGSLPIADDELARVTLLPPERWVAMRNKVLAFFIVGGGFVTHKRLRDELQKARTKSTVRAIAGARGGQQSAAKRASKTEPIATAIAAPNAQAIAKANAQRLLNHSSDIRDQKESSVVTRDEGINSGQPVEAPGMLEQCLEAIGVAGWDDAHRRSSGLLQIGPLVMLVDRGYTLDGDILPVLRDWKAGRHAGRPPNSWGYFTDRIVETAERKRGIPPRPEPAVENWAERVRVFEESGAWGAWGPRPGEAGCRVPAEFLKPKQGNAA